MFPKFNNSSVISHSTQARAKTAAPVLTAAGKEGPVPAAAATVLLPPASLTATRLRAQGGQNRNVCLSRVEPRDIFPKRAPAERKARPKHKTRAASFNRQVPDTAIHHQSAEQAATFGCNRRSHCGGRSGFLPMTRTPGKQKVSASRSVHTSRKLLEATDLKIQKVA